MEETIAGEDAPAAGGHQAVETAVVVKMESMLEKKVFDQAADLDDVVEEKPVAARMAPMEPRKIVLGLRPNSLKLTNASQKELDRFVEMLKLYPRATVYIKGFVSAKSNSPENIKLSEDRAVSVQKLMLAKGIEAEQVEVVGMGNQDPVASNTTSEGRRKNRRVEVVVIDGGI